MNFLVIALVAEGRVRRDYPGGYCHNSGTRGSPDAVKVGPPPVGPPRRQTRQGFNTGRCPPPICPTATRQGRHQQSRLGTGWPSRVTLNPADDAEVPGTRTPGRRLGSPPGSSLHTSEEDKLASSGWKLLEDLGTKKTKAPRRDMVGKGVSPYPPALQKVGEPT